MRAPRLYLCVRRYITRAVFISDRTPLVVKLDLLPKHCRPTTWRPLPLFTFLYGYLQLVDLYDSGSLRCSQ
jgi:hypothetical protein